MGKIINYFNDVNKYIPGVYDPYILAEIGVNHNGDIDLAKSMIDAAIDSGADAVKFQTFKSEKKSVTILETGTARGFSALCMAKALEDSKKKGIILTFDILSHNKKSYWRQAIHYNHRNIH